MGSIVTIGEILVEIVASEMNQTFDKTGSFTGPYPSGAPAIFIDQAARCGSDTKIVSAVGNDGFGKINLDRLTSNGVDVSHVKIFDNETTGSAFVTYQDDGNRDFIFNITNAACGKVDEKYITSELMQGCSYFHIMGSSVYSEGIRNSIDKVISMIKDTDTQISFDPNVRKEILDDSSKLLFLQNVLKKADIVLAGDDELEYLMGSSNLEKNINTLLYDYNAKIVVVKYGSKGSSVHTKSINQDINPYLVQQVDPTGAGDCFAGTFVSCINQGMDLIESATYASAAGALAVTKVGPMEGNASLKDLELFIRELL